MKVSDCKNNTQLSKLLKVTPQAVSNVANGKCDLPINWCFMIASEFDVSLDYLVFGFHPQLLRNKRLVDTAIACLKEFSLTCYCKGKCQTDNPDDPHPYEVNYAKD